MCEVASTVLALCGVCACVRVRAARLGNTLLQEGNDAALAAHYAGSRPLAASPATSRGPAAPVLSGVVLDSMDVEDALRALMVDEDVCAAACDRVVGMHKDNVDAALLPQLLLDVGVRAAVVLQLALDVMKV
jgi:hypothetical protein